MPPQTAERLKIRCYRCNQLLAVAPTKAGTVVACPKCKADLLIPHPGPQPTPDDPADPSVLALKSDTFPALAPLSETAAAGGRDGSASPSYLDEISALIPPELAGLRPEDLRVEAEVFGAITRQPSPPASGGDPFAFPGTLSAADLSLPPATVEPAPAAPAEVPSFIASLVSAPTAVNPVAAPPPLPISVPAPETNVVVPPIRLDTEAIRTPVDAEPRGIHQVVLPASVVLAWSLFVLLAIPMAFLAGLMIGHFLWRTGP